MGRLSRIAARKMEIIFLSFFFFTPTASEAFIYQAQGTIANRLRDGEKRELLRNPHMGYKTIPLPASGHVICNPLWLLIMCQLGKHWMKARGGWDGGGDKINVSVRGMFKMAKQFLLLCLSEGNL